MKKSTFCHSILAVMLFLAGCAQKTTEKFDQPGVRPVSLEQAQVVIGLPGRYISYTSPLKFIFAKEIVGPNAVGQADGRQIISFKPAISGKAVWISRSDLEFQPDAAMKKFTSYTGTLHLDNLLDDPAVKPIEFMFDSMGNEVVGFEGEFKLESQAEPKQFRYQGNIRFTNEVKKTTLEQALKMKSGTGAVALQIDGPAEGRDFTFASPALAQGRKSKYYTLMLDSKLLATAADSRKKIALQAGKRFEVENIEILKSDDQAGLVTHFTDYLSREQSPDGFVRVSPYVKVQLKSIDRKLYIRGDFAYNQAYEVEVLAGIKNRWDETLKKTYGTTLTFEDMKPSLRFKNPGVFLTSENNNKITFETLNVKEVRVEVIKVFANNLGQFLQSESLHSRYATTTYHRNRYACRKVGVTVAEEKIYIGEKKNAVLVHALDLKKILSQEARGLFIVKLWFDKDGMLYENEDERKSAARDYWEDYYTNPYKEGYRHQAGTAAIQIIVSDIGLTVKQAHERYYVFANHLKNTEPLANVKVRLMSPQHQVVGAGRTNSQGVVEIDNVKTEVFYVEGEWQDQRSVVKLSEMAWNLSGFAIAGVEGGAGKNRAFIYTDRGVYRPGDAIHMSVLVRNREGSFPKNHPVTLKFYNPRNQMAAEKTSRQAEDGFYYFPLKTESTDMTGNWRVEIIAGGSTLHKEIKVETVIPNRLKVNLEPAVKSIGPTDKQLVLALSSTYLFGAPAAELQAKMKGVVGEEVKTFSRFPNFCFTHEGIEYHPYYTEIYSGHLDDTGTRQVVWRLPDFGEAPSGLVLYIDAKVFEQGGRFTQQQTRVPVNPYTHYIGLEKMESDYGYFRIPNDYAAKVVLVTPQGKPVAGQNLKYRIYRNERWWWWEYREARNRRLKFKTHNATDLVKEGTLVTSTRPMKLKIPLEERGEYLLEVQHGEAGHTAGYFFHASRWGGDIRAKEDAGNVVIKTDKEKYFPGDKAQVRFPVPGQGRVLYSLERGNEVLKTWWEEIKKGQTECVRNITISKRMLPTTYLSVSILQPHAQTRNDLSMRLYGVIPLQVEEPGTRKPIQIKMKDELKPGETFSIELQSEDQSAYQATVAVVDVGVLDLTGFQSPDPWEHFFQKMRLGVSTFDLYAFVIGANKSDIAKLFAIGGGGPLASQQSIIRAQRFKPVALFKGPCKSNPQGKIEVEFKMPNYIGAVRVMAVAAKKQAYGFADKTVPVRKALMVQPTIPRVLGPAEKFILPVNVITMRDGVGEIELRLETQGPLEVEGEPVKILRLPKAADKMIYFKIKTKPAVGPASIWVKAKAKKFSAESKTEIAVRPSAPRSSKTETQVVKRGASINLAIPNGGIRGTNRASITIQRLPSLDLGKRLEWLIRYPYGCIEQTVSSVFPQLYLKSFLADKTQKSKKIDKNIQKGIDRLRKFSLPSGGFSSWPGGTRSYGWGTNYAGHFLLEAEKKGYPVPKTMLEKWKKFQHSQALKAVGTVKERVYRVYLLALAGEPAQGPMNLLKENNLKAMDNAEQWLLAAAYYLSGSSPVAGEIAGKAGFEVKDYRETGNTLGSGVRDRAIILETLVLMKKMDAAFEMFEKVGESLSSAAWYSTQTTAYSLLAMGKYLQAMEADYGKKKPRLMGQIVLPNDRRVPFDTTNLIFRQTVTQGFGQNAKIVIASGTTQDKVYVTLNWDGIPLMSGAEAVVKDRLSLQTQWIDERGAPLDESALKQGTSFYGRITVRRDHAWRDQVLENIALVQIMPSGWEIENLRLTGEPLPVWLAKKNLGQEDYLDIRDDRVMWFFTMGKYQDRSEFVVKINTITAGDFVLPATQVEAMYDIDYKATQPGKRVKVVR